MRSTRSAQRRGGYETTKQAAHILQAARRVFARDGASGFSARRVAREARLGLGSLQHVFPTFEALLTAMFADVVAGYDLAYRRLLARLPLNPIDRVRGLIDYLVEDLLDDHTRRTFFGLWELSGHNAGVARVMQRMYAHHRENVAGWIAAVRSDLDDEQCRLLAAQVIALIDGAMIFTAPGSRLVPRRQFIEELKRTAMALIGAAPASGAVPPPGPRRQRAGARPAGRAAGRRGRDAGR